MFPLTITEIMRMIFYALQYTKCTYLKTFKTYPLYKRHIVALGWFIFLCIYFFHNFTSSRVSCDVCCWIDVYSGHTRLVLQ